MLEQTEPYRTIQDHTVQIGIICYGQYGWNLPGSISLLAENHQINQKNRNFWLKIGYNSGRNIKYTWLIKVEYLHNGSTDLYEILNLSS